MAKTTAARLSQSADGQSEDAHAALAPAVRRLLGVIGPRVGAEDPEAVPVDDPRTTYRTHLAEKYGGAT